MTHEPAPEGPARSALVATECGRLLGTQNGPVTIWRGVPYAAPPVGNLRFRPPAPPVAWEGVREASEFGAAAPQPVSPMQSMVGAQPSTWDEDCLSLNIFAPSGGAALRPVMVWIHGGSFVGGAGSIPWYDGTKFADGGGVVLVTINYRLGALGFLELGAVGGEGYRGTGNCGLLDQLAALRWIRDNIAAFGGDPDQVTVFGESSGAMCIGTMLVMPAANGLFQRAILQSGAASSYRTLAEAEQVTDDLLAAFGGSFEEFLSAPVQAIVDAQAAMTGGSEARSYIAFRPVVDGVGIPEPPDQAIAAGHGADVPVLVGTNRDEMSIFLMMDTGMLELSAAQFDQQVASMVGAERWARVEDAYRATHPEDTAATLLSCVTTDFMFRIPAIALASGLAATASRTAPVWMYRFDWQTPLMGGALGASHGLDIPFVWNLMDFPALEMFAGSAPGRNELAAAMHGAWLAFATTGDPSSPLLPDWPAYQPPRRATMVLNAECYVEDDPKGQDRQAWDAA